MKETAMRRETYYVRIGTAGHRVRLTKKFEPKPVTVPRFDGFRFVVHRGVMFDLEPFADLWKVTEQSSGLAVADGADTPCRAINQARRVLREQGVRKTRKAVEQWTKYFAQKEAGRK